ncbi:MAG: HEPN domain-containing protein [Candidatus Bathyarchaeota archaeon]|nr:HEPN domain-containing protein [Candidatus Bathyarchaeota archaeon]
MHHQRRLREEAVWINSEKYSRYIQTTSKLSSQIPLILTKLDARIHLFTSDEAKGLADIIQRRNIFARHSWENSFYVSRTLNLANRTVIEVLRAGDPDEIIAESQRAVDIIQKVALLSCALAIRRKRFQHLLGIEPYRSDEFDIVIGRNYRYLRSKSKTTPVIRGISIDERFCRRFFRCGFHELAFFCTSSSQLADRVTSAISWLAESREEPLLPAALVKTSIALESLLGFDKSEPLAKSLSERVAFLLSSEATTRERVGHLIKTFYNQRSRTVHGNKTNISYQLIEAVDRLAILTCLIIAINSEKWKTGRGLRKWCENMKWGKKSCELSFPFPDIYMKNAMKLFNIP